MLIQVVILDISDGILFFCIHSCFRAVSSATRALVKTLAYPACKLGQIDCSLSTGTIFGIYKKSAGTGVKPSVQDLLKPGTELIAAGYALYDSATMIVLSTGLGVNGFTLDPSHGEFVLTHPSIRIPRSGKFYSINEGNSKSWDTPTTKFVDWCKEKKKGSRYVGSMVGDVHRTLLYGGTQKMLVRFIARLLLFFLFLAFIIVESALAFLHSTGSRLVRVPRRRQEPEREAAPNLRMQPDGFHYRAGRRACHHG